MNREQRSVDDAARRVAGDGDELVTIVKARHEFEAANLVAVLREAGIDAFAFGMVQGTLALESRFTRVPVQVRATDAERARAILRANAEAAEALDWETVDVGQREDALPPRRPNRMPPAARLGMVLAILAVLSLLAGAIIIIARLGS